MPRSYFHVRSGDVLREDPEGSELHSDAEALQEAIEAARKLIANRFRAGYPVDGN